MLRGFRLGNHRSFRDEQELVLALGAPELEDVADVAAVLGAGATGKSNLLDGLRFVADAVRESYRQWDPLAGIPRHAYRLDAESAERASVFAVELQLRDARYRYGFEVDDERVQREWMHRQSDGEDRTLFTRERDAVALGESLGDQRERVDVLARLTRPNALFLSLASQLGMPELSPVYRWFTRKLRWAGAYERPPKVTTEQLLRYLDREGAREWLLGLIRAADSGISECQIDEDEFRSSQRRAVREARLQMAERQISTARDLGNAALVSRAERERDRVLRQYPEPVAVRRVRFRHGEHGVPMDLSEESDGTRSWLAMLPAVLAALETGSVLVIDEIDASLHPRLSVRLIGMFQSRLANPRRAQLLFTAHDASPLGPSFRDGALGRGQVWLVVKDQFGASRLHPPPRASQELSRGWRRYPPGGGEPRVSLAGPPPVRSSPAVTELGATGVEPYPSEPP